MRVLKQGTTPTIVFLMVGNGDHVTPITGLSPVVTLSKNGASGTTATNNPATQVDATNHPGWYKIALTTTETNTIGDLILHATGTGADPSDRLCVVESADISDLDGEIDAILSAVAAVPTTPLLAADTRLNNLDAAVSSRLPTSGYTAPPGTVTLAASQPNYAPAKTGDAMTLTAAYDAAKTAAPTTAQIDTALTAAHGAGSWQSGSGGGGGTTGTGITPVNHDTGGTDALRYLAPDSSPVDGGGIVAFLKSSYDAGNFALPLGSTETRSDGRWKAPLMLDAGVVHTIAFYKQGALSITTIEITP